MKTTLSVLIVAGTVLAGCSAVRESRMNPFNWFGGASSEPVITDATGAANPLIPARRASILRGNPDPVYNGWPVETIDELLIEKRPGGAILRVTGIADRAGPFDVRLIEDEALTDADTLAWTLKALQSAGPRNVGPHARKVTVALWLTDQDLLGIRELRVAGQTNALVTRR